MGYKVTVNDTFHFDLDNKSVAQVDAVSIKKNNFHILHENKAYQAEILSVDFLQKKYSVKINSNTYTVAIASHLDSLIKEMGFETSLSKQVNFIKAPMPGLILEISVVVGQTVKENDNLIILGAMKMENSFLSPRDGVIKSISVQTGDAVDKGQLLIEFE